MEPQIFQEFTVSCMRILPAGLRPRLVNPAPVVGFQKGAGCLSHHPVTIFVVGYIPDFKVQRLHAQKPGSPPDIILINQRRYRLTAMGAIQTVNLRKHPIMQFGGQCVDRFAFCFAQGCQILSVLTLCPISVLLPVIN